jgi:hypothetical protein
MKTFSRVWLAVSMIAIGVGIGILVIAFASGARWEDISPVTSMYETYDDVKSLDFDITYGEVKIVKGNEFSISAHNIIENQLSSYLKDGIWYIREDESNYFDLLGISFPARHSINLGWNDHFSPYITITIPEDFSADNISLRVEAGSVIAEQIITKEGDFNVKAGELQIDKLMVSGKSQYRVAAGEMMLSDVNAKDITVDCGIGSVKIDGIVTGDNNIKCGLGEVNLNLDAKEEDYSYDINCGIGEVKINDEEYDNIRNKLIKNEDTGNNLYLDCGVGGITVDFN